MRKPVLINPTYVVVLPFLKNSLFLGKLSEIVTRA